MVIIFSALKKRIDQIAQQTQENETILDSGLACNVDGGPTLTQHWVKISRSRGVYMHEDNNYCFRHVTHCTI